MTRQLPVPQCSHWCEKKRTELDFSISAGREVGTGCGWLISMLISACAHHQKPKKKNQAYVKNSSYAVFIAYLSHRGDPNVSMGVQIWGGCKHSCYIYILTSLDPHIWGDMRMNELKPQRLRNETQNVRDRTLDWTCDLRRHDLLSSRQFS